MRRHLFAAALLLAGASCSPGRMQQKDPDGLGTPGSRAADSCLAREVSRAELILEGGRRAYVEPTVLQRSAGGDVLLAGQYNHQFEKSGDRTWKRVRGDSLLGAVVLRAGPARAVLAPFPSARLSGVRAAELGSGRWAVVFAEVPQSDGDMRPDSALRLWHGVIEGGRWAALETMPMPDRGTLRPQGASSLVHRNGALAWAMTLTSAQEREKIILYEFKDGRWSYEQVPTSHAQVEPAYTDSLGLLLAVVQADPALRSDGNSLLLWARQPAWRVLRTVVPGSREQVFHPSLRFTPDGAVLGWTQP
jgi:hypothetical protein